MKKINLNQKLWLWLLLATITTPALALTQPLVIQNSQTIKASQLNQLNQASISTTAFEQQAIDTIEQSYALIAEENPTEALTLLDIAIKQFEQRYELSVKDVTTTYVPAENVYIDKYLVKVNEMNKSAPELADYFTDLLYLKAYTLVEMGELKPAIDVLNKAIAYDPSRANSYSELGHVYQSIADWTRAEMSFEMALTASQYSEPAKKITHKTRAIRGLGFVAIELGKLDIAEAYYYQSLELDPNDEQAKIELKYIENLRQK